MHQSELSTDRSGISLIGLPGSGKTAVGRQLAQRLRRPFVDADAVIEQRIDEPIRKFFEREGEERFRDVEEEVVADLLVGFSGILATGGGAVLRPANRDRLRSQSTVIYLDSSPEVLFRRLRFDAKRPLLQVANPYARLQQLHRQRDPLYRETAHYEIPTGHPSVAMLVNMVLTQLELAGIVDAYTVPAPINPAVLDRATPAAAP